MTHNNSNPWNDLSLPANPGSYSSRRVFTETPHNFYWAKNDRGQCCLIFFCDLDEKVKVDDVRLKGIELEQHISNNQKLNVVIKLIDDPSRDLFRTISNDLIAATIPVNPDNSTMVIRAINLRMKRWRDLLGRKQSELLSKPEQIGLFGELRFLQDYFLHRFDNASTAVATWQGPTGSEQDFGWSNMLFEVKTQLSTSDRKVFISSLEQLDDISGKIWLAHQTVAADEAKTSESQSLKRLVDAIRAHLSDDIFASDGLNTILMEIGYADHPAYDEVRYLLNQRMFFRVDSSFPKLKRSEVSPEIITAKYTIDIAAISSKCVEEKKFLREVFSDE